MCMGTLIVLITVKHVGHLDKKSHEKVFYLCWKGGKMFDVCAAPDMSVGQMFLCYCLYMSLSGFFTILLYLVLTIFSPSFLCSLSNIVLEHFSSVCFPLDVLYTVCLFVIIWHIILVRPFKCYSSVCRYWWMS